MAERDRLVESLAHLDVQIAGARSDLQRLARFDEQELCESRLIILQVPAPALHELLQRGEPHTARPAARASSPAPVRPALQRVACCDRQQPRQRQSVLMEAPTGQRPEGTVPGMIQDSRCRLLMASTCSYGFRRCFE